MTRLAWVLLMILGVLIVIGACTPYYLQFFPYNLPFSFLGGCIAGWSFGKLVLWSGN